MKQIYQVKNKENSIISYLIHGDCTSLEVKDLISKKTRNRIGLHFCDLPYEVVGGANWDKRLPLLREDLHGREGMVCLLDTWKGTAKAGCPIVLTASQPFTSYLGFHLHSMWRDEMIWEKANGTSPALCKSRLFRCHESVLVFSFDTKYTYNPQKWYSTPYKGFKSTNGKNSGKYGGGMPSQHRDNPTGERYPRSVQKFAREVGSHPTAKPLALMDFIVRSWSNEGEWVCDLTMGSGSTGIAALEADRKFIGVERDPEFFKATLERFAQEGHVLTQLK